MARVKKARRNHKKKPESLLAQEIRNEIAAVILLALGLFIAYCLWTGPDNSAGTIGAVGRFFYLLVRNLFGEGKVAFPVLLIVLGLGKLRRKVRLDKITFLPWVLLFFAVLVYFQLRLPAAERTIAGGWQGNGGGLFGASLTIVLLTLFGEVGAYIFVVACIILAVVGIIKKTLSEFIRQLFIKFRYFLKNAKEKVSDLLFEQVEEHDEEKKETDRKRPSEVKLKLPAITGQDDEEQISADSSLTIGVSPALIQAGQASINENGKPSAEAFEPLKAKPDDFAVPTVSCANNEYRFPPVELLDLPVRVKGNRLNKNISENIRKLEQTLENFGVKAKVTRVSRGPSITQYEIQPAPGVKVSRIVSLADDIALSLAATQVRIEAPIPGKAAVGIEVPNEEIAVVSLREVLKTPNFQESDSKLTIALGKDIAGSPIVADLSKMPHLLIAGATGSGKSVCMNAIIASILFKATPEEVKLLMIDPKVVELTNYNGIPHLISPVVTEPKKAASSLRWAVHEMENRYELFAAAGVKDISRYNELCKTEDPEGTVPLLPYIVVLIDELADLMMVAPADVEDAICRLAQMARAAGIHLVVATQRPSVDVITGVIKANIPSRIAFAVSSQTDSRTILDMGGAEKLLGRGDMLFYPTGMAKPIRVQGVFVSDQEIDRLVEFLKEQKDSQYITPWLQTKEEPRKEMEEDELLPEAARIFIESGQASISLLQRRLRIGYTRAARIIDQLEQKGIVGGYEGSKPRAIKMTWDEYEKTFGK